MKYQNYTYEQVCSDYETYWIVDRNGEVIAQTHNEDSAALIVASLNGVA